MKARFLPLLFASLLCAAGSALCLRPAGSTARSSAALAAVRHRAAAYLAQGTRESGASFPWMFAGFALLATGFYSAPPVQ